jgi:hypothetical protein
MREQRRAGRKKRGGRKKREEERRVKGKASCSLSFNARRVRDPS